jgi:hypothetical protein
VRALIGLVAGIVCRGFVAHVVPDGRRMAGVQPLEETAGDPSGSFRSELSAVSCEN